MTSQEILDLAAAMNRMLIPDHYDRTWNAMEHMLQKDNDFLATEYDVIGLQMQLDLALPWTHAHRADQIQAFIVFDTRAKDRRLPPPRPRSFERRDQRKATFIGKNEGCAQLLPLFLYAARRNVSNAQSLHHPDARRVVAVFGNSSRGAA